MIHRRKEGGEYKTGINWTFVKHNSGHWWFSLSLQWKPYNQVSFRFRTGFKPHIIWYGTKEGEPFNL